jgi:hypothetical protein
VAVAGLNQAWGRISGSLLFFVVDTVGLGYCFDSLKGFRSSLIPLWWGQQ